MRLLNCLIWYRNLRKKENLLKKKVIFLSPVVSHPAFSGNSTRIAQMLSALSLLEFEIHFVLAKSSIILSGMVKGDMENQFGNNFHILNNGKICNGSFIQSLWSILCKFGLNRLKIGQDHIFAWNVYSEKVKNEFKNLVDHLRPDVIICEYAITAGLIAQLTDGSIKIVDTHDFFTDRNERIRATGGRGLWWNLTEVQERSLLSVFDYVIAIQNEEAEQFKRILKDKANIVKIIDILTLPKAVSNRNTNKIIGFVGSDNFHNREGLKMFITKHWVSIKQAIPDAKLIIAGDVKCSYLLDGITHIGRANSLKESLYDQCTLIINPCLSGSGLKIKTIEAMSYGLPVITTPEGASGLLENQGLGLIVQNLISDDFAKSCIRFLNDIDYNEKARINSRRIIETKLSTSLGVLSSILN